MTVTQTGSATLTGNSSLRQQRFYCLGHYSNAGLQEVTGMSRHGPVTLLERCCMPVAPRGLLVIGLPAAAGTAGLKRRVSVSMELAFRTNDISPVPETSLYRD